MGSTQTSHPAGPLLSSCPARAPGTHGAKGSPAGQDLKDKRDLSGKTQGVEASWEEGLGRRREGWGGGLSEGSRASSQGWLLEPGSRQL